MTASVSLSDRSGPNQSNIMVPLAAIYQTHDKPYVWVINDHVATLRQVQVGSFGNTQVQIVSGLNPGDTIVTAGVHKLQEGQTVKLSEDDTP